MQYPKMLYKGDQENYQTIIADDEDHEAKLIADDWVQYSDLPEQSKNQHIGEAHSIDSAALVPVEQFDALALKVAELEQENAELSKKLRIKELEDTSADDLKVAELEQENAELSKKLRIKELEDTSADDLKVLLTERNVPFGARDSKAVLLNLVIETE